MGRRRHAGKTHEPSACSCAKGLCAGEAPKGGDPSNGLDVRPWRRTLAMDHPRPPWRRLTSSWRASSAQLGSPQPGTDIALHLRAELSRCIEAPARSLNLSPAQTVQCRSGARSTFWHWRRDSYQRLIPGVGAVRTGVVTLQLGNDGTVRVWRLADGTPVGEPLRGHTGHGAGGTRAGRCPARELSSATPGGTSEAEQVRCWECTTTEPRSTCQ